MKGKGKKTFKINLSILLAIVIISSFIFIKINGLNSVTSLFVKNGQDASLNAGTIVTAENLVANSVDAASQNSQELNRLVQENKNGGTVIIPEGTYYIDDPIVIPHEAEFLTIKRNGGEYYINSNK